MIPHRTLPLTGGSKARSNSETESLGSSTTGVSDEVRRGSSTASPYGFEAVDPSAGLRRISGSSLSGIEGLLGGTGIAESVSSWDVDADVGVFAALGSGSSSVQGQNNIDRTGSVRSDLLHLFTQRVNLVPYQAQRMISAVSQE